MTNLVPVPRTHNPFGRESIRVDAAGVPRYRDLPSSLLQLLKDRVEATPAAEAVVELGGERLTYAELWERASRVAGGLRTLGLERGGRVAIRYPAGIDWVLAFWGTLLAGGVVVAINTRSSSADVARVLEDTEVAVDLAPGDNLPEGDQVALEGVTAEDVAVLFFTSGTTGGSKGVPTTHEALMTGARHMATALGVGMGAGPHVRTLISVPLFHVMGCSSQLLTAVHVGGTAVLLPALDLQVVMDAITDEAISFLAAVPAVHMLLLRRPELSQVDVAGIRWIGYGGAPIAPDLVARLQRAFPKAQVINGYGLTETAGVVTVLPHEEAQDYAGSVGYAMPAVELGVMPLTAEDPSTGELWVRGANVFNGYWKDEAGAEASRGGWLRTGDIVRTDEFGRVYVVDRVKDIIVRGGEKVSSIEVEAVLVEAPGVVEAAVVPVPDDVMGEKVGAVLYGGDQVIDIDHVLAHCRRRLAAFQVPQYVTVVDEPLPRNPGGKLLKRAIRASVNWRSPLR